MLSIKIKDFDTKISYVIFGFTDRHTRVIATMRRSIRNHKIPPPAYPRAFGHFPGSGSWAFDAKGFPESGGFELYRIEVGNLNFKCQVFSGGIHVSPVIHGRVQGENEAFVTYWLTKGLRKRVYTNFAVFSPIFKECIENLFECK